MNTPLVTRDILSKRIDRTDWSYKLTGGEVKQYGFSVADHDELFQLGQHFSAAVMPENRHLKTWHRTVRVGFLGVPNAGKTELTNGIIAGGGDFSEFFLGGKSQKVGRSEKLGHVCRVDCNSDPVPDYTTDKQRSNTMEDGRLELIEHCQEDFRGIEKLHALFILRANYNSKDWARRDVELLLGPELRDSDGVKTFLSNAQSFRCV